MRMTGVIVSVLVATVLCIPYASAARTCSKDEVQKSVDYAANLLAVKGKAALPELDRFRFCGDEGYVFVSDMDGLFLLHPISKKLENKNQINLQDPKGKYIIAEMVAKVKKDGSGWVSYSWYNPASKTVETKCSYAKGTTMDGQKVWSVAGVYGISEAACQ